MTKPIGPRTLDGVTVAVPGLLTTAFLALRLYAPDVEVNVMPFDEIQPAVHDGKIEAGLLIHEGQLTYESEGLQKIVDLGEWWAEKTGGLPLPLGGNVIRRDLGMENVAKISRMLHDSIAYALNNREKALDYALTYGRGHGPQEGRSVRRDVRERADARLRRPRPEGGAAVDGRGLRKALDSVEGDCRVGAAG